MFCCLTPILCNSNIHLKLEGLDAELHFNVCQKLSDIDTDINFVDENFKKKLDSLIREGLRPLGYYSPSIYFFFNADNLNNKGSNVLVIKINPGLPVKVKKVNVNIYGDGKKDYDYKKIMEDSKSFIGNKLNHLDYEQFKNKFYDLAILKGYFDAEFKNNQLIVIPSLYQCIWNIDFYSGKRYFLEKIQFKGSQIKESYLNNISNIHVGEYYNAKSIMTLSRRLFSTNWFDSVLISPDCMNSYQKKNNIRCIIISSS